MRILNLNLSKIGKTHTVVANGGNDALDDIARELRDKEEKRRAAKNNSRKSAQYDGR